MLTNPCQEPGHDYTGVACQKCFAQLVAERDALLVFARQVTEHPQFHEGNGGCHGFCPVCIAKQTIGNLKNQTYLRAEVYMQGWDKGYEEGRDSIKVTT